MARDVNQNAVVFDNLLEEYVGSLFTAGAKVAAGSDVVRAVVNNFGKRDEMQKLRVGGKDALKIAVAAFTARLESNGRLDAKSAGLVRRALIEFADEFFRSIPDGGNFDSAGLIERYKKVIVKTFSFLKRNKVDEPSGSSAVRTDVLSDAVLKELMEAAESQDEFQGWMRLRARAMHLLHLRSESVAEDAMKARMAFDWAYFGDFSSNYTFILAISEANNEDELVDMAIAAALNASSKDYVVEKVGVVLSDVLVDGLHAVQDAVNSVDEILANRVMPWATVLGHIVAKAQAGAWIAFVLCVFGIFWGWFEGGETLTQKGSIGWAVCIIGFTAMVAPFALSIQLVEGHLNGLGIALRLVHEMLSVIPGVKAPGPIQYRDMKDPDQLKTTESLIRVFRWRAILALFGIELSFFGVNALFLNEAKLVDTDWYVLMMHVLLLGIVLSITIKFKGMTKEEDALALFRTTSKGLNLMYIGVLGTFIWSEGFDWSTRTSTFGVLFGSTEVARKGSQFSATQNVLMGLIIVFALVVIILAISMRNKADRPMAIGGIVLLTPVLILLCIGRGCSVEKHPPSAPPAPMAVWAKYGLDPKDTGLFGTGTANVGAQGEDPEMQALLDEKKRIAAQLAANRARRNAVLGL